MSNLICTPNVYKDSGNSPDCLALSAEYVDKYMELGCCEDGDSTLLDQMILTAQCLFESYTRRILMQRSFLLLTSYWCKSIQVKCSPLQSVESITYLDEDGESQTVDSSLYYIVAGDEYSDICFTDDFTFPSLYDRPHSITVTFTAGYFSCEDPSIVSADIQIGLFEVVAYLYENRSCSCGSEVLSAQTKASWGKYKIYSI